MVRHKKRILGFGLLAAAFFIIALLVAGAAMGGDGGMIDDRIVDLSGSEGESGDALTASSVTSGFNYQGRLTDSAGNPLDGTCSMTFKLYETATGGTALATDTHSVSVTNGLFSTEITFDPSDFDGRALWLGITIQGEASEMTPRQELQPVPYALSLRPGAVINSSNFYTLILKNSGNLVAGLYTETTGYNSEGIYARTYGNYSQGVYAYTSGDDSPAVYGFSSKDVGVYGRGNEAGGYFTTTTAGPSCWNQKPGVNVSTKYEFNPGVFINTTGDRSEGVSSSTSGYKSEGVYAQTTGNNSAGVYAYSDKDDAIYGDTGRGDHKYGVYTPDYMYAAKYEGGGSDVAEYFAVNDDVEPGTVMVIDPAGGNKLQCSTTAYDTTVAGIVSSSPGISLGVNEDANEGEELIAVAGRVSCKVDATYAPIKPGDLLTTSATRGHAMKATTPQIGTILGKALEPLESGTGVIEVLVTLT
jgi:hypothetical protein